MVSENFAKLIGVVSQITQTVAIIIAGFWALYVWTETVLPGTVTGIQANGEVSSAWSEQAKACRGTFRIILENIGIKKAKLGEVTYSIAPIPVQKLREGESFRLLRFTDPTNEPISGAMDSLQGIYAPKEKRLKEIPFIYKPNKDVVYSIEVVMMEEATSTVGYKWYAEVPDCKVPPKNK